MEFSSVNKLFEKSIRENWDRPALSNYQGVTLFYRDIARRIAKLHIAFEQCGLNKGDKVAICSRNQSNWGVSFLAAMTYGAVPVPILHEFKAGNIHYLVNHSEARVLFVDDVIWEGLNAEEMPELAVVVQINTFHFLYAKTDALNKIREHLNESFGRRYPNNFVPEDLNYYEDSADELALINYTSGTSGFSKGVMVPYRALYSNIVFAKEAEPHMNNNSDVVSMLPSAHMYGMMFEFLFEMTIGAHVHFLTRIPSPKVILQAFADIKPDVIVAVPLIIEKSNDILNLKIQSDDEGKKGDVRDIVIMRGSIDWEIGLSLKHNHFAVKHSRLSKKLDFGEKWYDIPCSEEYWKKVKPIFDFLEEVLAGIQQALDSPLRVKINCVIVNSGLEWVDLIDLAKHYPLDVRFIELMPIGTAQRQGGQERYDALGEFQKLYPNAVEDFRVHGNGPAKYYTVEGFCGSVGFISALSHKFCRDCNRIRLTSTGILKRCLCFDDGINVRQILSREISDMEKIEILREAIYCKPKERLVLMRKF